MTSAAALQIAGATLTGSRLRHLKTVGDGISALSPSLWLRQAGFAATPGGVITSWPSEVGGFAPENSSWHDAFPTTNPNTSLLVVPNAFKGTDVIRFGLDAGAANSRKVGLWNANNAAFALGNASGIGFTFAAVVRLLPVVTPTGATDPQILAMLGNGDPSTGSTFDWSVGFEYATPASVFQFYYSPSSGPQNLSAGAALQNAFGFVCFAVNQTGAGSGTIDGYVNATQVVTAAAYSSKSAASSSYPLLIGRPQGTSGLSVAFGQFDLAELAIFPAYLNAGQVAAAYASMMGNL
jgi:hypothetical protein